MLRGAQPKPVLVEAYFPLPVDDKPLLVWGDLLFGSQSVLLSFQYPVGIQIALWELEGVVKVVSCSVINDARYPGFQEPV